MLRISIHIFSLFFGLSLLACQQKAAPKPAIIPTPQVITMTSGMLDLSAGFEIEIQNTDLEPLRTIIQEDYLLLLGKELDQGIPKLILRTDPSLKQEEYKLEVAENISISGGSYPAVAMAQSTLWQGLDASFRLPKMSISDHPDFNYRSVMLDAARAWHHPETIKEIIDLCRWYKINYLHLHLTDDSAFSFPSDAFPALATEGHSYTKQQLIDLNQYAYERGVILVPELDVPGHASEIIKKMPELFGIAETANSKKLVLIKV